MDEARFEAFYRRTASGVWSYLYRMVSDAAAADDLLQKTFIRFLRAEPSFASEEHMRRYLYRTATTVAVDHFRENRRRVDAGGSAPANAAGGNADLRHDLGRVFAELKPRERLLLWLAHVEEADHAQIAEALRVRPKSVKVLLFRARRKLADVLARRGIGPEDIR